MREAARASGLLTSPPAPASPLSLPATQTLDQAAALPAARRGRGPAGASGDGAGADGGPQTLGAMGGEQQEDGSYEAFVTSERAPVSVLGAVGPF